MEVKSDKYVNQRERRIALTHLELKAAITRSVLSGLGFEALPPRTSVEVILHGAPETVWAEVTVTEDLAVLPPMPVAPAPWVPPSARE